MLNYLRYIHYMLYHFMCTEKKHSNKDMDRGRQTPDKTILFLVSSYDLFDET